MRGTPRYWAIHHVNEALREMIYGKIRNAYSGARVRDKTDALAAALFDALGSDGATRLREKLAKEIDIGGTTARRKREFEQHYGGRGALDVLRGAGAG